LKLIFIRNELYIDNSSVISAVLNSTSLLVILYRITMIEVADCVSVTDKAAGAIWIIWTGNCYVVVTRVAV